MDNKKLGFVCLSYNQCKNVLNIIKNIQSVSKDIEIVVIDDCSSDNTCDTIRKKYPTVNIIENKFNTKNQSRSRNIGIKTLSTEYIMFIDGDDMVNTESLKTILEFVDEIDNYDVIFTTLNHISDTITYKTDFKWWRDTFNCNSCSYIIRKSFLINNNIFYDEDKYYYDSEDCYFSFLLLSNAIKSKNYIHLDIDSHNIYINKYGNTFSKYKQGSKYISYIEDMVNDLKSKTNNINNFLDEFLYDEIRNMESYNKNSISKW